MGYKHHLFFCMLPFLLRNTLFLTYLYCKDERLLPANLQSSIFFHVSPRNTVHVVPLTAFRLVSSSCGLLQSVYAV